MKPRAWKWIAVAIATESWGRTARFCVIAVTLMLCSAALMWLTAWLA